MLTFPFFLIPCMLFLHVVDDYYLQGVLANMKQRDWWIKNTPEDKRCLYCKDYLMALGIHSFSWSFMIMLPLTFYYLVNDGVWFPLLYVINTIVHFFIDNEKANRKRINLITDQTLHIGQILLTWIWCYVMHGM